MTLLTDAEALDLAGELMAGQPTTAIVFYRETDGSGATTALPAQDVVRTSGRGSSNAVPATSGAIETGYVVEHFARLAPFDVRVGDWFELDGHKGGRIIRVRTDPVLPMIVADGTLPVGAP